MQQAALKWSQMGEKHNERGCLWRHLAAVLSTKLEGMGLETGQLGWKVVSKNCSPPTKQVMVERMKQGQV